MEYRIVPGPDEASADHSYIVDQLKEENDLRAGLTWPRASIRLCLRGADDEVLGGIFAAVSMHTMAIEILWVDPRLRGQGAGAELVTRAEDAAREMGTVWATVETTSFQARPFYEQLGYECFAELEDSPIGHTNYWLKKRLLPAAHGSV